MSLFFNQYIIDNTPKGKGLYTIKEMHDCWLAAQMSVVKFTEMGGSLNRIKDAVEQFRLLEMRLEQSGHIEENVDEMKKVMQEREKIDAETKREIF